MAVAQLFGWCVAEAAVQVVDLSTGRVARVVVKRFLNIG